MQTPVVLLTAHIQCIPSVITTVALSTGILKFAGALGLGRSRPKNCSIPSVMASFMIDTVTVVVFDPTGKLTGTALALVIPVKSAPSSGNEEEKTRKEEKETYCSVKGQYSSIISSPVRSATRIVKSCYI